MLEKKNLKSFEQHYRASKTKVDHMNIYNEINLYDIFNNEEVDKLLKETIFGNVEIIDEKDEDLFTEIPNGEEKETRKKLSLFDRMSLIQKLLQLSVDKLNKHKEHTIAKGIEW